MDYLGRISIPEDYFPRFSLFEVNNEDVKRDICRFTSHKYQTGFKKHHSTQAALLKLTDDIRMRVENKYATIFIQFDFSKAFHTVSPSWLIMKLRDLVFSRIALQ